MQASKIVNDPNTISAAHDLALLRLEKAIPNWPVKKLATQIPAQDAELVLYGFGCNEWLEEDFLGERENLLLKEGALLWRGISKQTARERQTFEGEIVTGTDEQRSQDTSCYGDSGGPLLYNDEIVGIVSRGSYDFNYSMYTPIVSERSKFLITAMRYQLQQTAKLNPHLIYSTIPSLPEFERQRFADAMKNYVAIQAMMQKNFDEISAALGQADSARVYKHKRELGVVRITDTTAPVHTEALLAQIKGKLATKGLNLEQLVFYPVVATNVKHLELRDVVSAVLDTVMYKVLWKSKMDYCDIEPGNPNKKCHIYYDFYSEPTSPQSLVKGCLMCDQSKGVNETYYPALSFEKPEIQRSVMDKIKSIHNRFKYKAGILPVIELTHLDVIKGEVSYELRKLFLFDGTSGSVEVSEL